MFCSSRLRRGIRISRRAAPPVAAPTGAAAPVAAPERTPSTPTEGTPSMPTDPTLPLPSDGPAGDVTPNGPARPDASRADQGPRTPDGCADPSSLATYRLMMQIEDLALRAGPDELDFLAYRACQLAERLVELARRTGESTGPPSPVPAGTPGSA